jgi:hypothetical protein
MASGRRRSQLLSQIPGGGPSMLVMKTPAAEGFSVSTALDGRKGEAGRYYARNDEALRSVLVVGAPEEVHSGDFGLHLLPPASTQPHRLQSSGLRLSPSVS